MDTGTIVDRVTAVLQEVAAEVIEPRFANLKDADVEEKAPRELVTTADTEAEALLARRLEALLPGVPVVGEEDTSAKGGVPYDLIGEAPRVWLVDPLDGTHYRPDQTTSGLLVAAGEAAWATVRTELLDLEPYSPR